MRRELVDFQIPAHKVGDNLVNTVTDWHSYCLDNQSQTFNSRMPLRITQDTKKTWVSMDRVCLDGTQPAKLFSFLRRFGRACSDRNFRECNALYLVGFILTEAAATRFKEILADTAGHFPGRTVASFPEAIHWLLKTYANSIALNQAVSDVNRASLGAHEVPDAFAACFIDLRKVCKIGTARTGSSWRSPGAYPSNFRCTPSSTSPSSWSTPFSSSRRLPRLSITRSRRSRVCSRRPPGRTWHDRPIWKDSRRRFYP